MPEETDMRLNNDWRVQGNICRLRQTRRLPIGRGIAAVSVEWHPVGDTAMA